MKYKYSKDRTKSLHVRINNKEFTMLERLEESTGFTKSDIVRMAIDDMYTKIRGKYE